MPVVRTVYVAMSGGVDSSVAALLLTRQGYRVVGVFMMPWQAPGVRCQWQADRSDALRVAAHLNIPLETWDFSKEYYARVTKTMIAEYRAGRTPNPDVLCNQHIKFGLFARRAFKSGASVIATGHYAQVHRGALMTAKDSNKDQTYFLWSVPGALLKRTLFPIGHLTKPQVRALARRAGLPVAEKKDSQGVCFVGDLDMRAFLQKHIKPRRGRIMHVDGRFLGWHTGAAYYTRGQRHGLDIKTGGGPYYVVSTDVRKNTITVGARHNLQATTARIAQKNWLGSQPVNNARVQARVRYRAPLADARLGAAGRIHFLQPVQAVTPGQSIVLYQKRRVLGGGVII